MTKMNRMIFESLRRRALLSLSVAGAVGLNGRIARSASAEPPPETTRIRLVETFAACEAPQFVAVELLRNEGFTDVQYIRKDGPAAIAGALSSGEVDVSMNFSGPLILRVDRGEPITILAGIHPGCYELFTSKPLRSLRDLKGRSVAVRALEGPEHVFMSSMMAHVGLDPRKDVNWVTNPSALSIDLLAQGKVDAFLGFPPQPQQLRAQKIGHVLVNSNIDRPWSNYFCCMLAGNRDFVRAHPIATKRALRAILKGADLCATEPDRTARFMVETGRIANQGLMRQVLTDVRYDRWREFNPEDTVRFFALRLREAGMIKSSPQKILTEGADWRFLNELKKELKS